MKLKHCFWKIKALTCCNTVRSCFKLNIVNSLNLLVFFKLLWSLKGILNRTYMSLCCFCCSADCIKNLTFSFTKLLFDSVNIFKSLKFLKKIISLSLIASRYLIIICIYYRIHLLDFSVLYSYLNDIWTSLKLISAPCSCSIPFTVCKSIFTLAGLVFFLIFRCLRLFTLTRLTLFFIFRNFRLFTLVWLALFFIFRCFRLFTLTRLTLFLIFRCLRLFTLARLTLFLIFRCFRLFIWIAWLPRSSWWSARTASTMASSLSWWFFSPWLGIFWCIGRSIGTPSVSSGITCWEPLSCNILYFPWIISPLTVFINFKSVRCGLTDNHSATIFSRCRIKIIAVSVYPLPSGKHPSACCRIRIEKIPFAFRIFIPSGMHMSRYPILVRVKIIIYSIYILPSGLHVPCFRIKIIPSWRSFNPALMNFILFIIKFPGITW